MLRANKWLSDYWGSSTLDDVIHGGGFEKEIIIRNNPYWTTINPDDFVYVDGEGIKMFLMDYSEIVPLPK